MCCISIILIVNVITWNNNWLKLKKQQQFLLNFQHPIGRFSEAGLLEWMRFVIFPARGRRALPGWFLSGCCFTLCVTVEIESRIMKQYKCQYCCSLKKYCGKGMEDGKKVSLHRFVADQKIASLCSGASCSTSNKLLLTARHILTTGLKKCLYSWQCKIRKFTVTAFHCEERMHRK